MSREFQGCAGPVSRRGFLQIGSLGLSSIGFADFLRLRAQAAPAGSSVLSDNSVIFVMLPGGLSHMETYDMKPEAPAEFRGEFRPIRTNVPGIEVNELMPLHATIANRFSLIRSIFHEMSDHGGGHKRINTGRIPKTPFGTVNDAPAAPSIVAKMREHIDRNIPHNIAMVDQNRDGADRFALGAAYLGPSYTPFEVPGNPSSPNFKVHNMSISNEFAGRLEDRVTLLDSIDKLRRELDMSGSMAAMDKYSQQAFHMLTNKQGRDAFDLSKEGDATRDRYGRHAWGQRMLMARRLIEAGSSFVTVVLENPLADEPNPIETIGNWDCHAVNCHIFVDFRWRIGYFDQAVTALIEDIYQRGLDKKVLIVVLGEFSHTPRISYSVGTKTGVVQPGRDHWPQAQSVLVSGGGLKMGQVIGSTSAKGETPKDRPLTPNDLWATIYRHLGIDYNHAFLDHTGRPMPILPFGEPIRELI